MWPRVIEILLAVWLAASPLVLSPQENIAGTAGLAIHQGVVAAAIIVVALASLWKPLRRAYLLQLVIGVWLIGYGYLAEAPAPALENAILVGLFLLMFGILPGEVNSPPRSWQQLRESAEAH